MQKVTFVQSLYKVNMLLCCFAMLSKMHVQHKVGEVDQVVKNSIIRPRFLSVPTHLFLSMPKTIGRKRPIR